MQSWQICGKTSKRNTFKLYSNLLVFLLFGSKTMRILTALPKLRPTLLHSNIMNDLINNKRGSFRAGVCNYLPRTCFSHFCDSCCDTNGRERDTSVEHNLYTPMHIWEEDRLNNNNTCLPAARVMTTHRRLLIYIMGKKSSCLKAVIKSNLVLLRSDLC